MANQITQGVKAVESFSDQLEQLLRALEAAPGVTRAKAVVEVTVGSLVLTVTQSTEKVMELPEKPADPMVVLRDGWDRSDNPLWRGPLSAWLTANADTEREAIAEAMVDGTGHWALGGGASPATSLWREDR